MSSKGALLSAGAGAIVAMAGVYIARKVKGYVTPRKPRMRLFHNNLFMSTRCAWLIAGAHNYEAAVSLLPFYAVNTVWIWHSRFKFVQGARIFITAYNELISELIGGQWKQGLLHHI